ncbi:Pvc16 family protein [Pseudoalteromonas byunsanensis]
MAIFWWKDDVIDLALRFVEQQLNQTLRTKFALDSDIVIMNHLVESNGTPPLANQNKLVITLINLEHETNKQFYGGQRTVQTTQVQQLQPTTRFNLDILLTAHFDSYNEALKFLSASVAFFQAYPTLTKKDFPNMPSDLFQLQFEIENSPYTQTHNLWSALGAKYQPSIIYKIRHVAVQSLQVMGSVGAITDVDSEASV